jgi:hypothetical protein
VGLAVLFYTSSLRPKQGNSTSGWISHNEHVGYQRFVVVVVEAELFFAIETLKDSEYILKCFRSNDLGYLNLMRMMILLI